MAKYRMTLHVDITLNENTEKITEIAWRTEGINPDVQLETQVLYATLDRILKYSRDHQPDPPLHTMKTDGHVH